MKDGYIQQVGTPQQVFETPKNLFVAGFIGSPQMNFMKAKLVKNSDRYAAELYGIRVELDEKRSAKLRARNAQPGQVILGVRPEHAQLRIGGGANAMVSHLLYASALSIRSSNQICS